MLRLLYEQKEIVAKFYEPTAFVLQQENQNKLFSFLQPLTPIPLVLKFDN